MRLNGLLCALLLTHGPSGFLRAQNSSAKPTQGATQPKTILRTTVRRVVLDVVVSDAKGRPVRGLSKADFVVTEDGQPQRILSCDANGFAEQMDYLPPSLPAQPANTFINLPSSPEKGPLYVLLYDLTNMDTPDQMTSPDDLHAQLVARQQMMRFIEEKPEGARFAIFVRSDGLHLIQGFTSDKALLLNAVDPHAPRPHFPKVFLMGPNFGRGDRLSALETLHSITSFLDGLPGRKNLIWFASQFPVSLFADDSAGGVSFHEGTKSTLELLAQNQVAVYPVDARGVALENSHGMLSNSEKSDTVTSTIDTGGRPPSDGAAGGGTGVGSSPSGNSSVVQGNSAVMSSFNTMDELARETGGAAFYGTNDVARELLEATQSGGVYYTLTYAPTDANYDGRLRHIHVELADKIYSAAYRRSYYGAGSRGTDEGAAAAVKGEPGRPVVAEQQVGDTLAANMQYGAPESHALVFVVQAQSVGAPAEGTAEEMAELATEPAYFKSRRKTAAAKPLRPVLLQKDTFSFNIPMRQFSGESALDLEIAAAVYDADGRMMNGFVRVAKKDLGDGAATGEAARFYRIEQELEVPVDAASVRFAVRDTSNDRLGAIEVKLPLAAARPAAVAAR